MRKQDYEKPDIAVNREKRQTHERSGQIFAWFAYLAVFQSRPTLDFACIYNGFIGFGVCRV
jgi:hypothetical protein